MPMTSSHASPGAALIIAENVSWRTPGDEPVLKDVTLALGRSRSGLIGPNGAGKTTLARILVGALSPRTGIVTTRCRVGYLPQNPASLPEETVAGMLGVETKLDALRRLSDGHGTEDDLARLDDDWDLEARVETVLADLRLEHVSLAAAAHELSGGERTRVALAGRLLEQPDFLVLDEPTNDLDRSSRHALYGLVERWRGGALVISHDRQLLALMDRIVELSPGGLQLYGGNYDLYVEQRAAEDEAAQRAVGDAQRALRKASREHQQNRERKEQRDRRGRRTRRSGSQPKTLLDARKAQAERTGARLAGKGQAKVEAARTALDTARGRVDPRAQLDIELAPVVLPSGKSVVVLEDVVFRYPSASEAIVRHVSFSMTGPERVALIGENGAGKTTLLHLVAGRLSPDTGRIVRGVERWRLLDQQADVLAPNASVLENFRCHNPEISETVCRLTLARFLFRGEAVHQRTKTLSGGERLRAALACVLSALAPPQLLILDEPTNHLDLDSLANLEAALRAYRGALLVVSHDDAFLEAIGVERSIELSR